MQCTHAVACAPPPSMVNLTRKKRLTAAFAGLDPREPLNAGFAHHSCLSLRACQHAPWCEPRCVALLIAARRGRPAVPWPSASENDDFFDAVPDQHPGTPLGASSELTTASEPATQTGEEPVRRPGEHRFRPWRGRRLRRHGLVLVLPARQGPGARHGHHVRAPSTTPSASIVRWTGDGNPASPTTNSSRASATARSRGWTGPTSRSTASSTSRPDSSTRSRSAALSRRTTRRP